MSSTARRLAALERRFGPAAGDAALNARICRILAAELGIDPAELWAEAERIARERRHYPTPEAYAAVLAAEQGVTVAELMADAERVIARAMAEGAL